LAASHPPAMDDGGHRFLFLTAEIRSREGWRLLCLH
jgi:hypothetical protein